MRSDRSPEPTRLLRSAARFAVGFLSFFVHHARLQERHGARAVLVLRAFVLAFDNDAGRQVRQAHRRIGLVDVLTAGARMRDRYRRAGLPD